MSCHIPKHLVIERFYVDNDYIFAVPNTSDFVLSALRSTIETVQIVEGLIPLQIAKGVLSTVASILTIVKVRIQHFYRCISLIFFQNTIQNKDDFAKRAAACFSVNTDTFISNSFSTIFATFTSGMGRTDDLDTNLKWTTLDLLCWSILPSPRRTVSL
jgi:hypothetical protein